MTAFTVVNMLLGAGLLAAAVLFITALVMLSTIVGAVSRAVAGMRWPDRAPGLE